MSQHPEHSDGPAKASIAVIGAGIVGLAVAYRLARELGDVVLIDRGEPGMATSYGNAGHIATEQIFPLPSPATLRQLPGLLFNGNAPLSLRPSYALRAMPWLLRFAWASRPGAFHQGTAALTSLQEKALPALRRLCRDAAVTDLLQERGHLLLVENPALAGSARAQMDTLRDHGVAAEWLEPSEVADLAPGLADSIGAVHVHGTAYIRDPLSLSRGLLRGFLAAGGRLLRDNVVAIDPQARPALRLRLSGSHLMAERTVLCAGAWSGTLARQTGFSVPLDTERGYHLQIPHWQSELKLAVSSLDRHTIMTPMSSGVRITGFVELGGLELPPTPARLARLHQHLDALLPEAPREGRREWMGFRPSLPDHMPVLGRHPRDHRVLYAFGHQHLGLTLAAASADIVLALATDRDPDIEMAPFRIDRF